MNDLKKMLEGLDYQVVSGSDEGQVSALVYDSRKVVKGCIFVCIKGFKFDGHSVAAQAVSDGASVLVVSDGVELPEGSQATVIKTGDTRYALALLSAAWFDHPAKQLRVIAVTGTKGKTTTACLTRSVLEGAGIRTGLIGTIETVIGDEHIPAANTTPESYVLQETLRRMVDKGLSAVVMEASSQGFMLHRTACITFDHGLFTNIEPDHIGPGEHSDFEDYLTCKSMIFSQSRVGIINADDAHAARAVEKSTCDKLITYGLEGDRDIKATDIELINSGSTLGVSFHVSGLLSMDAYIDMPGRFSVYNALGAIAICHDMGIADDVILSSLRSIRVRGRIEMIHVSDSFSLMIDYAHNAMALESLLKTLRAYSPGRLVCLFGCGGNRSRLRRFEMGEVSGREADLTVITSDNPRDEEPLDIIADIRTGISKTDGSYVEIPDRREAIKYVIENGRPGDVIVLAGKGHEDYQEIKGKKHHMDERELIADILKELGS